MCSGIIQSTQVVKNNDHCSAAVGQCRRKWLLLHILGKSNYLDSLFYFKLYHDRFLSWVAFQAKNATSLSLSCRVILLGGIIIFKNLSVVFKLSMEAGSNFLNFI